MEMELDIFLADKPIGTAQVKREGLYYSFFCKCRLSGEVVYKLVAYCDDKQESLGVCVPMNGQFGLVTRVPIKRLGNGRIQIRAEPRKPTDKGVFVPIRADEPFLYLEKLEKSFLEFRKNQPGIVIYDAGTTVM